MKTVRSGILSIFGLLALSLAAHAQADAKVSQAEAVRQFPDLAKAGSEFNKVFLTKLQTAKAAQDPVLSRDDWPMILASAVANELGAKPGAQPAPQSQPKKPNLVQERMSDYHNPLDKPANAKTGSTDGLPWPIEGHAFTLTELNRYRTQIAGQIVWVKLWPTSIDPEPVGDEYKVFVKDGKSSDRISDDSSDQYAFVWFPVEGAKKMRLIGTTIGGGLSFYVKVEKDRLTAVARSRNIDSFHNTFTYTW
jgi:hypothetical protein